MPEEYSEFEALRNGRRVEIRALRPEDRDDFIAAVRRIGTESLYRRFFAVKREFSESEKSFFVDVDFVTHVALIAVIEEDSKPVIAGGGRYIVVKPGQAEVAFVVVDKYHGQGIGTILMRHLVTIARRTGLRELIADVLPDNRQMLKVFEKSGLKTATRREFGEFARHAPTLATANLSGRNRHFRYLGRDDKLRPRYSRSRPRRSRQARSPSGWRGHRLATSLWPGGHMDVLFVVCLVSGSDIACPASVRSQQ